MTFQDLLNQGGSNLSRPFLDPFHRRRDDPLLGGQQLGGGVAPVTAGGRYEPATPGPHMLRVGKRNGLGIRQHPDHAFSLEELGGECHGSVGGDVEGPGHGADRFPASKGRPQQGDGDGPGVGSPVVVDLPVVERHALLPGQDPEDGLGVLGSG